MSWDPITQKHKGFAFVEYEMPEAAQLALEQMNGVIISGRNIKVGRPSNMPQAQVVIDDITQEAKNYDRIYIASIHQDLSQEDIKSVFEAFGKIKTCELAMTSVPGRHKGYGFIEYLTSQAAQEAISSMNLFDLGGQYLRVGRAITPPDTTNIGPPSAFPAVMPTKAAVAAAAATARIQAMDALAPKIPEAPKSSGFGPPVSVAAIPPPAVIAPVMPTTAPSLPPVPSQPPAPVAAPAPPPPLPSSEPSPPQPPQPAPPPMPEHAPPPPPPSAPVAPPPKTTSGFAAIPPPGVVTIAPPGVANLAPPGVTTITPTTTVHTSSNEDAKALLAKVEADAQKKQQAELQKKLMEGQEPSTLQQQENLSIKGQSARHLVMQKLMRAQSESVVVVLKNMVTAEEVDEELNEEIEEECAKFGEVEKVIIYQERQSEEENAEIIVKIFVEFKAPSGAVKAKEALNGRFFGGRRVQADIYDQDLYDHSDLSG